MRRPYFAYFCASSLALFSAGVSAQEKTDFSVVRFRPAVGPGNYVEVEGTTVASGRTPSLGVAFDYARNPLVVDKPCDAISNVDEDCRNEDVSFVAATGLMHLMGSVSLFERAQLSLVLPFGITDTEPFNGLRMAPTDSATSPAVKIQPAQGFAIADALLSGKVVIAGDQEEPLRIAVGVYSTLPTAMLTNESDCRIAGSCTYLGERGLDVGAKLIGELALDELHVSANVGGAYRPSRELGGAETGSEIRYGVAGEYHLTPLVAGVVEITGAASLLGDADIPTEARGALKLGRDFVFTAGAGGGLFGTVGNPSLRVFAVAQWTPVTRDADDDGLGDDEDACPGDAEDRDGFMDTDGCPESDNDGDGVVDASDSCKNEREDFDKFQDEDGCPENDNDGDGVPDGYDACEGQKEDLDGDRDDDGCPDLDTDRDGVPDAEDACKDAPEDTDGLADADGCPEEDADGDAVNDTDDACPDATEWWNGILDNDGCPEDDEDKDSVPDQIDRCPDNAETLNGETDADGCPDSPMIIVLNGQRLLFVTQPESSATSAEIKNAGAAVDAIADYVRRNHQRGSVHVVMVAPPEDKLAKDRAESFARLLRKRITSTSVTSGVYPDKPARLEIELLPPGWKELPRPKPKLTPAPEAPAPATPAAPAPRDDEKAPTSAAPNADQGRATSTASTAPAPAKPANATPTPPEPAAPAPAAPANAEPGATAPANAAPASAPPASSEKPVGDGTTDKKAPVGGESPKARPRRPKTDTAPSTP